MNPNVPTTKPADAFILRDLCGRPLPDLSTPAQIAEALQVTPRCVLQWERTKRIRAAFRSGRVVRFCPKSVAEDLGIKSL